nr:copper resistance protein NlpE N-terminal domain-containing protein [Psychrobacter coccoides]
MLPCSFCDSISVTLNLLPDGSVIKTNIYENPETPRVPLVEHGLYRQDNDVITVVYDNQDIEGYSIQNSHLIMIDDDKQPITDYTLARK